MPQDTYGSDEKSAEDPLRVLERKLSNSEASSSLTAEGMWEGLLAVLPEEVLIRVMEYMSAEDLNVVNQVCRYLRWSTADDRFWQPLYQLR